jgi:carboxyl-terminal processing protease
LSRILKYDTIGLKKFMKNSSLVIFVLVGLAASFGGGFFAGKTQGQIIPIEGVFNLESGRPTQVDFAVFWDAWNVISQSYVGIEPLDFQAMVHGAVDGMVGSLGDPYTAFLSAEDTKIFLQDIEGSFSGVGMEIGIRDDRLQVIAPLEGTPAEKAGLRAGDYIVHIDEDKPTRDLTIDQAVAFIRGPVGTTVTLGVLREGWSAPRDFSIERATIDVPSLRLEFPEEDIAYVKLFQFSEKMRSDFRGIEDEVFRKTDKVIIDLRNNPGGFLHIAVDIAGWFLERGDIVVIEDFGSGLEQKNHAARGNNRFRDHKVVILINEGSASASEILAGALRDNRGTLLIGKKSFGKGSVQELKDLKDKSSLKVTVASWLTPKGEHIAKKGLEPDIEVEITEEDFDANRDPQLDRAIEVLKNL